MPYYYWPFRDDFLLPQLPTTTTSSASALLLLVSTLFVAAVFIDLPIYVTGLPMVAWATLKLNYYQHEENSSRFQRHGGGIGHYTRRMLREWKYPENENENENDDDVEQQQQQQQQEPPASADARDDGGGDGSVGERRQQQQSWPVRIGLRRPALGDDDEQQQRRQPSDARDDGGGGDGDGADGGAAAGGRLQQWWPVRIGLRRPVVPFDGDCDDDAEAGESEPSREEGGPLIGDAFADVNDKYDINSAELGTGRYGIVRKCTDRNTGEAFAVKTIKKAAVGQINVLRQEVQLLREVSHPNIIRLVDVFEDEENVHLVTELATGGELFDKIVAKRESSEGRFSESEAARIVRQILDAVSYCHDVKDIVHRDVKPENFLFASDAPDAALKLIDFGYATRHTGNGKPLKADVGTALYTSPEIIATQQNNGNGYDRKCDVWAVGIIAYTLLAGFPPFNGPTDDDIYESVSEGRFRFVGPHWDDISLEAKDFICKVLKKDPELRITATAAKSHDWVRKFAAPVEGEGEAVAKDLVQ